MKKNILIFIIIILSIILEVSFLPKFFSSSRVPELVLIAVIFLSIWDESKNFWKWALAAGLIFDIMSFQALGLHSFSFLAISFLARFISTRFLASQKAWNFIIIVFLIFLGSFLNDWLAIIFIKLEFLFRERKYLQGLNFSDSGIFFRALYGSILGAILYNPIKNALSRKLMILK